MTTAADESWFTPSERRWKERRVRQALMDYELTERRRVLDNAPSCIFCRIVNGEAPATVLWRNDRAMVIIPLNPVVDRHVISIPYRHAKDFTESWETTSDAMHAAFQYAQTLDDEDCNLITSKGHTATQSIFHLHVHIVPRRENDGLALPWYSGKRRPTLY